MSSSPPPNPYQWRYTWETLAHIPTLRLYLSNPAASSLRCLTAALLPAASLLHLRCLRADSPAEVHLHVPVPRVLIDPTAPVDCVAKADHIEVKLSLLLPVDHPMVSVLDPGAEEENRRAPICLGSDLKSLSSGDVHFYCKACSTKLTRQPLSHFVEMPSANWQEVADNWFGGCCCSFGGASEKLVSQYNKTYNCPKGTSLLDDASVILCNEDLEGCTFEHCSDGYSKHNSRMCSVGTTHVSEANTDVSINSSVDYSEGTTESDLEKESSEYRKVTGPSSNPLFLSTVCCGNVPFECDSFSGEITHLDEPLCADDADTSKLIPNRCSGSLEKQISKSLNELSLNNQRDSCADKTNTVVTCVHEKSFSEVQQPTASSEPGKSRKWLHNSSLGSGFIIRSSNLSNDVEWVKFVCRQCSCPLGCFPSLKNTHDPIDGGVRLFKCYVSTSIPTCGTDDIFRKHTLDRVFVNSLLESAEDELSFRTIVRDLGSKSVKLQIVLLNSKAWSCNGFCYENASMKSSIVTVLQPIVKVLFSDCSSATESDLRIIKDWSTKTHVEEVYMMPWLIEELAKHLKMSQDKCRFPAPLCKGCSCRPWKGSAHKCGIWELIIDTQKLEPVIGCIRCGTG